MEIGGIQKFSLMDYPGQIAAVIFTPGCNFRCQFCYNPMLVWPDWRDKLSNTNSSPKDEGRKDHPAPIAEDDLFVFLARRQGKLDAVVISGGEPTIHPSLPEFLARIKAYGYKIKLDTNGTNPAMLRELTGRKILDYIAMDVKAPLKRYEAVAGTAVPPGWIKESVALIRQSGLSHEFRTTLVPGLVGEEDLGGIGRTIKGADRWFLQRFKSDTDLVNADWEEIAPFSDEEMERMRALGARYVKECRWR